MRPVHSAPTVFVPQGERPVCLVPAAFGSRLGQLVRPERVDRGAMVLRMVELEIAPVVCAAFVAVCVNGGYWSEGVVQSLMNGLD